MSRNLFYFKIAILHLTIHTYFLENSMIKNNLGAVFIRDYQNGP